MAFDDARSETLVEILEAGRRAGEDLFEVAERMMIVALGVKYNWVQLDMARRIGVSPRVLNYKLASYRMRPKDRKRWAA